MKATLLFFLFATSALSADFRTLDFGGSCDSLVSKEATLGSTPAEWPKIDGAKIYAFNGTAFDSEVMITYLCSPAKLLSGNYYFAKGDLAGVLESYEMVHKKLTSTYGAPFLDNSRWMEPFDQRWLQADPGRYSTTWKTPRTWVEMNILPRREGDQLQWQLVILYAKPTGGVSSNKSLERTRGGEVPSLTISGPAAQLNL